MTKGNSWWTETMEAIAAIAGQAQTEATDSINQWLSQSAQSLEAGLNAVESDLETRFEGFEGWWEEQISPLEEAVDRTLEEWEVLLQPWMAPLLDWHVDPEALTPWNEADPVLDEVVAGLLTALGLDAALDESGLMTDEELWNEIAPKTEPRADWHPACVGCQHFHGRLYGGNLLICAMHPYGAEGDRCADWEAPANP